MRLILSKFSIVKRKPEKERERERAKEKKKMKKKKKTTTTMTKVTKNMLKEGRGGGRKERLDEFVEKFA